MPANLAQLGRWNGDVLALSAPAPVPMLVVITLPANACFDVGAPTIGADCDKTVAAVAEIIKKDKVKINLMFH